MASKSLCFSLLLLLSVFLKPLHGFQINDVLSPLLSPVLDDICKSVECGKGSCRASTNNVFLFECVCQPGWKQTASTSQTDHLNFLPCVIPNCTMDYSCSKAPQPSQNKSIKPDDTIFDPCYWSYCGVGSCNKTSKLSYNCECPAGFNNLLNVSSLPCFHSCEMGMDCANLGISSTNGSSNPAFDDKSYSSIQGRSFWSIIALTFVVMVVLKLN